MGLVLLLVPSTQIEQAEMGLALNAYRPAGLVLLLTAIWGLLVTLPEVRRWLARWIPLDPTSSVHTLALMLSGYLVGNNAVNLTQGGLEALTEVSNAETIVDLVFQAGLFVAVSLAGVGIFVRRSGWKLLDRLGLEMPTIGQLRRSLRWVALMLFLQWAAGILFFLTNPEEAEVLENLNTLLLGNMDTVWEWFLLALSAAVGEEILFRGALQPVLGIWLTAFIFAFAHAQYGLTVATALVFVVGVILGLLRERTNTSVAIFVHFIYNFTLGLLTLALPYLESLTG
jgi:membrane protease YdiL (CAAX protease family)